MLSDHRDLEIFKVACETGETCVLEQWIIKGYFNVNGYISWCGRAKTLPWEAAVEAGSAPVLKLLVNEGAKTYLVDYSKLLPIAISKRNPELAKFMLELGDRNDFTTEADYEKSFNVAYRTLQECTGPLTDETLNQRAQESLDTMKIILEHYRDYSSRVEGGENYKISSLRDWFTICKAIVENDTSKMSDLLIMVDSGKSEESQKCKSAISISFNLKRYEILKVFITKYMNLESILSKSISEQNRELIKLCIDKGMNHLENKTSFGANALAIACVARDIDIYILLVETYGLLPEVPNIEPSSLIDENFAFIKRILNRYPELINEPVNQGNTLLRPKMPCEIIVTFLKYGIDLSMREYDNQNLFHYCGNINGKCKIMSYLDKLRPLAPGYDAKVIDKLICFTNRDNWQQLSINEQLDCISELKQLKEIEINSGSLSKPRQTLYDYIFFNPSTTARYAKNEIILKLRQDCNGDFENNFKNYGFIINYQIRRGQRRQVLMGSARDVLHEAFGTEVPEHLTDLIFQHLSDKQIKQLSQRINQEQTIEDFCSVPFNFNSISFLH